jgi:hypothetical protein
MGVDEYSLRLATYISSFLDFRDDSGNCVNNKHEEHSRLNGLFVVHNGNSIIV